MFLRSFHTPETAVSELHRTRIRRRDFNGRHELSICPLQPCVSLRAINTDGARTNVTARLRNNGVSSSVPKIIEMKSNFREDHKAVGNKFPVGLTNFESNQILFQIRAD